jgi:hypothetical protein
LKAQLKLHKHGISIRLVINNRSAPSYKVAKKLNDILKQHLLLDNQYTTDNSISLAHNLTKLTINKNHRLVTLDIKDPYVNIPIREMIDITRAQLLKHDRQTTSQICALLETILEQNYFTFQEQIYKPDKGVAMGSPISGIIAEMFLQQLENSHIKFLLDSKHITFYSRYVDDIFIIYGTTYTNPDTILQYANSIHNSLQLTPTLEANNQISYLDLLIIRKDSQIEIDLYRKPTMTNTTINYLSRESTNPPAKLATCCMWVKLAAA